MLHLLLQSCTLAILTAIISTLMYRISPLHPLASIPGPWAYKISSFMRIYNCWKGKQFLTFQKLHDIYGPIVRIGPREISVINIDSVRRVLGPDGLPKGPSYEARRDPRHDGSIDLLHGEEHRNRRRLWNRGMNIDSLKEYEQIIARKAMQLVESLGQVAAEGKTVDMHAWLGYFTFDFTVEMAFGAESNLLQNGRDDQKYLNTIRETARMTEYFSHFPYLLKLPFLNKLPFMAPMERLKNMGVEWSNARLQRGAITKDLWYHLSDEAGLEKFKPTVSAVAGDGLLVIIAGSDTTSGALSNTLWFLISNPEYYHRLRDEIDQVFPHEANALDVSQYSRLPFLSACIRESLRVMPPVPTNGARKVPRGGGSITLCGHLIPENTTVLVPPYCVHRYPDNFYPNPDVFDPARWLKTDTFTHESEAFIPFSYGPANCAGRNLAMREMMMVLSLLMQKFDFRFPDTFDSAAWLDKTVEYFITGREPLPLVLTPRMQ